MSKINYKMNTEEWQVILRISTEEGWIDNVEVSFEDGISFPMKFQYIKNGYAYFVASIPYQYCNEEKIEEFYFEKNGILCSFFP